MLVTFPELKQPSTNGDFFETVKRPPFGVPPVMFDMTN